MFAIVIFVAIFNGVFTLDYQVGLLITYSGYSDSASNQISTLDEISRDIL